jgi:phage virion morphogenesis protein
MTGVTYQFDNKAVLRQLNATAAVLGTPDPILRDMGGYLMEAHRLRFAAQQTPDGKPWTPLSPRYKARKEKNKDKILILRGHMMETLRYQIDAEGLLFGSDRIYAALMHFGGIIKRTSRKKKSTSADDAAKGGAVFPARPFVGTSAEDDEELLAIAKRHMEAAIGS